MVSKSALFLSTTTSISIASKTPLRALLFLFGMPFFPGGSAFMSSHARQTNSPGFRSNGFPPMVVEPLCYRNFPSQPFQKISSTSDDYSLESASESVTGPVYTDTDDAPKVKLFTKDGCTLCDKVKDVLLSIREEYPHSLYAVDITDKDKKDWFLKYKYDIPVLHIEDAYWTKHKLSADEAIAGIEEAKSGKFQVRPGEPDAARLERY